LYRSGGGVAPIVGQFGQTRIGVTGQLAAAKAAAM
jgi:hypothetical protein